MKIRNFEQKDLKKILEFEKESSKFSFPRSDTDLKIFKKTILKQQKRAPETIRLIEDRGKSMGYIMFRTKKTILGRAGVISHIFIDKRYRGKDFGKSLVKEAEEYFKSKGISRVILTVTKTNKVSLNFCKGLGYKEKRLILEKTLK